MMRKLMLPVIATLLLVACNNDGKRKIAREKGDRLMMEIEQGTAINEFSEKNFPNQMGYVHHLLSFLADTCNFKNRIGGYVGDKYEHSVGTGQADRVYLFYLYKTECDSVELRLTYDLKDSVELTYFGWGPGYKDKKKYTH